MIEQLKKIYYRIYQRILYFVSFFVKFKEPQVIDKEDNFHSVLEILDYHNIQRVMLVTDEGIIKLGFHEQLIQLLTKYGKKITVYDKTLTNPTIDNIEEAYAIFLHKQCQAFIVLGGGSPIDCAKAVAARFVQPKKSLSMMKGLLKVRKKIPLFIAIPTTSGTGSEATVASVITDAKTHEKYAINDPHLIPHYALFYPSLTSKMPPNITAYTGMDALVHALEAYLGRSNTNKTKTRAKMAIKLIHEYLLVAYKEPNNLHARHQMQWAAYHAGVAFTRAYVGYVHCLAHQLGGFYNVPHGLANAVILPYVLEIYGCSIDNKLAELSDLLRLTKLSLSNKEKATSFRNWIDDLEHNLNIPKKLVGIINDTDVGVMVDRAYKEGNPTYPVPVILNKKQLKSVYDQIRSE
jgi:alcohol dehydrogenase